MPRSIRLGGADAWIDGIFPGKRADLVVLDREICAMDPQAILDTRVVMTVLDGRVVFEA